MALVVLGAIGAIGCGPETSTSSSGGAGGTSTGPVCPDDPATGEVPEECGIWVSVTMGDDANTGTQTAPVASLAHAIELADKGPRRVYACGETWSETTIIPSGVSLHGGFDCQAGWKYAGEDKRAALVSPSQVAITWVHGAGTADAFLTDFNVESADAVEPSSSSIAVFVRDAMTVHFRGCDLVAGDGADGEDGEDGEPNGLPGMAGTPGNIGADACSGMESQGGLQAYQPCPSSSTRGGAGGDSTLAMAADGQPGEPAGDPPAGAGGLGEQSSPMCTAGNTGANGANGAWGHGAGRGPGDLGQGHMTKEGYSGQPGHDGADAEPGQGGGGGGATFGSSAVCGAAMSAGAAGGSGGSGGCGGKGGRGGQPGGASIGIAAVSGGVFAEGVSFTMGRGGNGGNGGKPQGGGAGAPGGMGGKGAGSIAAGCAGGSGGNGGKGGWGGGGFGGAVAAFGAQIDSVFVGGGTGNTYHLGTPGTGGLGDPSHGASSNGKDGDAVIDPQFNP